MKFLRGLFGRLERASRIALGFGAVLAVVAIFLHPLLGLAIGALGVVTVAYVYPDSPVKVGFLLAVPVLTVVYLAALLRGFNSTVVLILLLPSFIIPVGLARVAADVRTGRRRRP